MTEKNSKTSFSFRIIQKLCKIALKLIGWKTGGKVPAEKKFVMVGYPHTSNWDTVIGLLIFTSMGLRIHWLAKDSLFKWPVSWLLKLIGAIPVNRQKSQNFIENSKKLFDSYDRLVLTLSPEGTRKKTDYWRTGFYYIALNAHVPIALAFLDYSTKTGGFGPLIWPSGDIKKDMEKIKKAYKNVYAKFPEQMGDIKIKDSKVK